MKGKHPASSKSHVGNKGEEETAANPLRGEVILGDLIWVRLHGCSWWPAQVVDENTVSGSIQGGNRSVGEVLVRLYGSYNYLYADPIECRSEFENILKQNNGSYSKIFKESLEQELPRSKSGRSKGQGSKSKEKVRVEASEDEKLKQNGIKRDQETEAPSSTSGALGKHPAVTVRGSRALKADVVARTYKDNGSEKGGTKQPSVNKTNLADNGTSAEVSPRRLSAVNTPQLKVKNGNLLSEKAEEEAKSKTPKQDGVQKKLKPNSPSSLVLSPNTLQTEVKNGNLLSEIAEEAKRKTPRKNGVQKKLGTNGQSSLALTPDTPQPKGMNGNLLLEKPEEKAKGNTSKQDGVQKKLKPNSPTSATTSLGKSQGQSARRMKVMQSLGLMAPSGSPFHRNGHT